MVTRVYFDRTPGRESDPTSVTKIINEYNITNEGVDLQSFNELADRVAQLEGRFRSSATITGAVGVVDIDVSQASSWLVTSTSGDYTLKPTGFSGPEVVVVYVTVYTTTTGHDFTWGADVRYVGLTPDQSTFTADEKRQFRFTYIPSTAEWIGEELSAQFELDTGAVVLTDAAGSVPDTSQPSPSEPITPAVYRFDSGTYASGGVQADETTVGTGSAAADANVYLAVVDSADGDAYASEINRVRWFVDPGNTTFTTWAATAPSIGVNGYVGNATAPPWKLEFDCTSDPTGQNDPSWDSDGAHDIYAQILYDNTYVGSVKVDLTVDNDETAPDAPGAPTSFSATAGDPNEVDLSWTAPSSGGGSAATPATGTDPSGIDHAWQSVTVAIPETTTAGQLVICCITCQASTQPTLSTDTGSTYTRIGDWVGTTSRAHWQGLFYKVAGASEADPTFTLASTNIGGWAICVDDVDTSDPFDATTLSGDFTPTGITTSTNDALVMTFVLDSAYQAVTIGTANGFTAEASGLAFGANRGSGWSSVCASKSMSTAGASGIPTWTAASLDICGWHTIALKPGSTGESTTATGYEFRYGESSPPTSQPFDIGNVTSYTVTGLTAGTTYYFQVRAYDALSQRGTWSSIDSATPTGSPVEPPSGDLKTVSGYSVNSGGIGQNISVYGSAMIGPGVSIPRVAYRANSNKVGPWNLATFFNNQIPNALNTYNAATDFVGTDPGKPRFNGTTVLSWTGTSARVNDANDHINSLLDLARCARGDYNTHYIAAAQALVANTSGGYDWVECSVVSPAIEANGAWFASYFGVQDELIGVTALTNASDAEWGADVADALREAGTDGDRGHVWALAWKQFVESFWSVDPDIWIGLNLAQESANPDGVPSGESNWNPTALNGIAGYFNSIDLDLYCRGAGLPTYDGSGDVGDPANYTMTQLRATLAEAEAVAAANNVAVGMGEFAAQFDRPAGDSPTDQEAAVWFREVFEWYNARPSHLAFLWRQADTSAIPAGSTYLVDPARHPLTWAVFQEYF